MFDISTIYVTYLKCDNDIPKERTPKKILIEIIITNVTNP